MLQHDGLGIKRFIQSDPASRVGLIQALGQMIFAVETEERALTVFRNEDEAVAHCEGLDVEAATWLFWTVDGSPLEAEFITPNKRGWFSVQNGTYRLVPASPEHHADLAEALDEILRLEPNPFFQSLLQVREHLAQLTAGTQDGA